MAYENQAREQLHIWQQEMLRKPTFLNKLSKTLQDKVNSLIPQKIHDGITAAIKHMVRTVLFGARLTTFEKNNQQGLSWQDTAAEEKIKLYRNTAAAEGAVTGAGGFLMGLADFPLLLAIKIKLLFEIAAIYGFNTGDYKERLYILHIFQLAFSSAQHRREVYLSMEDWDEKAKSLPTDINQFNWQSFQQEYRDYIDLAKMAQLIPVIGAPIGAIVNYRLIKKLGLTAIQAYHMRLIKGLKAA